VLVDGPGSADGAGDEGGVAGRAGEDGAALGGGAATDGAAADGGGGAGAAAGVGAGAGAGAPGLAAAPSASPITPTTVLIGTVAPASTRISRSTPDAGAGISASTLSVEISNSGSSRCTRSPTFFIHFVMVPSAIDSPIWGMMTSAI